MDKNSGINKEELLAILDARENAPKRSLTALIDNPKIFAMGLLALLIWIYQNDRINNNDRQNSIRVSINEIIKHQASNQQNISSMQNNQITITNNLNRLVQRIDRAAEDITNIRSDKIDANDMRQRLKPINDSIGNMVANQSNSEKSIFKLMTTVARIDADAIKNKENIETIEKAILSNGR